MAFSIRAARARLRTRLPRISSSATSATPPSRRRSRARRRRGRGGRGWPGPRARAARRAARRGCGRRAGGPRAGAAAGRPRRGSGWRPPRSRRGCANPGAGAPAARARPRRRGPARSRRGWRRCRRGRSGWARTFPSQTRWLRSAGSGRTRSSARPAAEEVGVRRERELVPPQRRGVLAPELGSSSARACDTPSGSSTRRATARQVLEERAQAARVEAGEERLHPEERRARVDGVEHLAHLGGGAVDLLGELAHRAHGGRLATRGEEPLARRDDHQLLDVGERPLRAGLEGPGALHLVAEELEPDRPVVERAPDVDHRAPHREGPGVLDQRDPRVPELDEPRASASRSTVTPGPRSSS